MGEGEVGKHADGDESPDDEKGEIAVGVVPYDSDDAEATDRTGGVGVGDYLDDHTDDRKQNAGDKKTKAVDDGSPHKKSVGDVGDSKESGDDAAMVSGDGKEKYEKDGLKFAVNATEPNIYEKGAAIKKEKSATSTNEKNLDGAAGAATKKADWSENSEDADKDLAAASNNSTYPMPLGDIDESNASDDDEVGSTAEKGDAIEEESGDAEEDTGLKLGSAGESVVREAREYASSTSKKHLDKAGAALDATEDSDDAEKNLGVNKTSTDLRTIKDGEESKLSGDDEAKPAVVKKSVAIEESSDVKIDFGHTLNSTGKESVMIEGEGDGDSDDDKQTADVKASSKKGGKAKDSVDTDNKIYARITYRDSDDEKQTADVKASSKKGDEAMDSVDTDNKINARITYGDSDDEKETADVKASPKMGGEAKDSVDTKKIVDEKINDDGEVNKKKTPGYTTKKVLDSPVFEKEYDNCIVGAGLSGSVIAENYATLLGQTSLILEKRHHIAGNCYDYIDEETGILVSLFGAHLFHTKHERVWEYVQRFSEWVPYEHKVLGMVNGKIVPIPVTIDTVNILFDMNITNSEEMDEFMKKERVPLVDKKGKPREAKNSEEVALATVGQRLYDLIFKPYTLKQWAKYPGTCVKIDY